MRILKILFQSIIYVTKEKSTVKDYWKFFSVFIFSLHLFINIVSFVILIQKKLRPGLFDSLIFKLDNSYYNDLVSLLIYIYLPILLFSIFLFRSVYKKDYVISKNKMGIIFILQTFFTYLVFFTEIVIFW
jgi:hypothetical protein